MVYYNDISLCNFLLFIKFIIAPAPFPLLVFLCPAAPQPLSPGVMPR